MPTARARGGSLLQGEEQDPGDLSSRSHFATNLLHDFFPSLEVSFSIYKIKWLDLITKNTPPHPTCEELFAGPDSATLRTSYSHGRFMHEDFQLLLVQWGCQGVLCNSDAGAPSFIPLQPLQCGKRKHYFSRSLQSLWEGFCSEQRSFHFQWPRILEIQVLFLL